MKKKLIALSVAAVLVISFVVLLLRGFSAENAFGHVEGTGSPNNDSGGGSHSETLVTLNEEETGLAELINKERANGGLSNIEFVSKLNECALLKAENMVEHNYFSHLSPDLGSPFDMMRKRGVMFDEAAENIAGSENADKAIDIWMNDKNQRANIMNGRLTQGGLAITESPAYGKMIVLLLIGNSNEGIVKVLPSSKANSQE